MFLKGLTVLLEVVKFLETKTQIQRFEFLLLLPYSKTFCCCCDIAKLFVAAAIFQDFLVLLRYCKTFCCCCDVARLASFPLLLNLTHNMLSWLNATKQHSDASLMAGGHRNAFN